MTVTSKLSAHLAQHKFKSPQLVMCTLFIGFGDWSKLKFMETILLFIRIYYISRIISLYKTTAKYKCVLRQSCHQFARYDYCQHLRLLLRWLRHNLKLGNEVTMANSSKNLQHKILRFRYHRAKEYDLDGDKVDTDEFIYDSDISVEDKVPKSRLGKASEKRLVKGGKVEGQDKVVGQRREPEMADPS
jgi:hypothetical protein